MEPSTATIHGVHPSTATPPSGGEPVQNDASSQAEVAPAIRISTGGLTRSRDLDIALRSMVFVPS